MTLNASTEKEIERFIRYIRKLDAIKNDEELQLFIQISHSTDWSTYTSIGIDVPGHAKWIRQMALLTDDQLRAKLRKQMEWDFRLQHTFDDAAQKRALKEMADSAKDYKANPVKFARKVDSEFR